MKFTSKPQIASIAVPDLRGALHLMVIEKFANLTGYTEKAVRRKIERGDWQEKREFVRAPDGRILIDLAAFNAWSRGGSK